MSDYPNTIEGDVAWKRFLENVSPENASRIAKLASELINKEAYSQIYKDGDKATIQGVRVRPDGTLTKRCKPGNETVFTLRVLK